MFINRLKERTKKRLLKSIGCSVLDKGKQIVTGTKDEIRLCEDERIVNMLNRVSAIKEVDGDDYIRRLTE